MKKVLLLASIGAILLAFWGWMLSPVFESTAKCFDDGTKLMNDLKAQVLELDSIESRKALLCSSGEQNFNRVIQCLSNVSHRNFVNNWVVNSFPIEQYNTRERLNKVIQDHNEACAETPINVYRL